MPKKKKSTAAAGGGAAAVKAKKAGKKKQQGPTTLRVLLGTERDDIVKVTLSSEGATVGELRALAVAAAEALEEREGSWAGSVLRRTADDALRRGACVPSSLEALVDDAVPLKSVAIADAEPPLVRLDKPRDESAAPETPFASLVVARASHILLKHVECAGNISRRTGDDVQLSKSEARKELEAMRAAIAAADDRVSAFLEAAGSRSDCASYASGGDLGNRGRGRMSKLFEAAIFGLAIHEMSGVVDTDVGLHLILRLPLEPKGA